MEGPPIGRLAKEDLHHLVEVAEGSSPAARRARELLLAHFSRAEDPAPVRRARHDASADRVRAALRELGVAPGEASVRAVASRAGLPATTTYRLLRELGAPPRRHRPAERAAPPSPEPPPAEIVVVGCGGAGARALHRLHELRLVGARTLVLDTDKGALDAAEADTKLLVGKSAARGLGAGGSPEVGASAAENAAPALARLMGGASLVFVVAGLGAGTGTGAAPVVARVARELGATVVAVASVPFHVERARLAKAEQGLAKLREVAHTVLLLDDERLLRFVPNLPLDQAFRVMDTLVAETVKGIVETLTQPALLNLDRSATRDVLGRGGVAALLYGEARATDPAVAVREAFAHPFLEAEPGHAAGAVVALAGGPGLALGDAQAVAQGVARALPPGAEIVCGARIAPELAGRVRLTVLLTGVRVKARTP